MILTLGLGGVHYWMPSLMVRDYGLTTGTAGSISGVISIIGVITGTLVGARLGRKLHGVRKGGSLLVGGTGITLGSLALGGALLTGSGVPLVILLLTSSTLSAMAIPNCTACIADVVGAGTRGLGFAVLQFLITIGAAFGPLLVGIASDSSGSLTTAMYFLIVPMVLGGLLTLAARGSYERDAEAVLAAARRDS